MDEIEDEGEEVVAVMVDVVIDGEGGDLLINSMFTILLLILVEID